VIANLEPRRVLQQVRIGLALCDDSFKVVLADKSEQPLPISVNVITVQQTFTIVRYDRVKPQLAVDQTSIAVNPILQPAAARYGLNGLP